MDMDLFFRMFFLTPQIWIQVSDPFHADFRMEAMVSPLSERRRFWETVCEKLKRGATFHSLACCKTTCRRWFHCILTKYLIVGWRVAPIGTTFWVSIRTSLCIGNWIRKKFHSHMLQLLLMVKPWKHRKKWFPDPGGGWNWNKNYWFWAFSTEPCLEGAASFHANFSHYFQVQAGNSEVGKWPPWAHKWRRQPSCGQWDFCKTTPQVFMAKNNKN